MSAIDDLIRGYAEGFYTAEELVGRSLDLLDDEATRQDVWDALPDWVKREVLSRVMLFSDAQEVVLFGPGDPASAKQKLAALKEWLRGK